jgi:hypothetical protein
VYTETVAGVYRPPIFNKLRRVRYLFSVCGWTRIEKGRVHEKYVDELYKYDQSSEIDTQAEEGK